LKTKIYIFALINALAYYSAGVVVAKSEAAGLAPGRLTPRFRSQSEDCEKQRHEKPREFFHLKNIFIFYEKRSSLLQRWRWSCKFQSRRIGSRKTDEAIVRNNATSSPVSFEVKNISI
jgi:hypothetical protein